MTEVRKHTRSRGRSRPPYRRRPPGQRACHLAPGGTGRGQLRVDGRAARPAVDRLGLHAGHSRGRPDQLRLRLSGPRPAQVRGGRRGQRRGAARRAARRSFRRARDRRVRRRRRAHRPVTTPARADPARRVARDQGDHADHDRERAPQLQDRVRLEPGPARADRGGARARAGDRRRAHRAERGRSGAAPAARRGRPAELRPACGGARHQRVDGPKAGRRARRVRLSEVRDVRRSAPAGLRRRGADLDAGRPRPARGDRARALGASGGAVPLGNKRVQRPDLRGDPACAGRPLRVLDRDARRSSGRAAGRLRTRACHGQARVLPRGRLRLQGGEMTEERGIDRRTLIQRAGALGVLSSGGLSALLAACGGNDEGAGGATTAAGKAVRGGRAVLATVDKPVNMDPADAQLYSSLQVYQNIFHKLVNVDADFKFIPGLASKWTQDDDTTWTLELVDNAVFQNGEPFTANDVKFSFDRLPEHANGIFVQAWKETEVVGPHTVRFHLSQPYGAVPATLAAIGDMVNEKAVSSSDPKLHPVGCGPYRMAEWIKDDHVTLERWDKFFKPDKPYLDEVVFRAIGDESVRLTGLQTGELDWIQRVPAQRVQELESASGITSSPGKPYLPDMVMFN